MVANTCNASTLEGWQKNSKSEPSLENLFQKKKKGLGMYLSGKVLSSIPRTATPQKKFSMLFIIIIIINSLP